MEKLFLNIVSLSLWGAIAGGILILLHPVTRKIFSKKWNYYVWLILALRLMLPAGFGFATFHIAYPFFYEESGLEAENTESGDAEAKITGRESGKETKSTVSPEEFGNAGKEEPEAPENITEGEALKERNREVPFAEGEKQRQIEKRIVSFWGFLWLAGAFTVFITKLLRYQKLVRKTKVFCRPVTDPGMTVTANVVALRLRLKEDVAVYESPQVSGPITMGLLKPFVVLPVEKREAGADALIFHHEFLHIKRKDLWYKWLWQLILCVHWFNPVFYKIQEVLSEDCELSCDERILEQLSDGGKRAYGNVLLDTAQKNLHFGETVFFTTLLEEKKALKERLKGIIEYKKQSTWKGILSLCAMAFVVCLSACGNIIISADTDGVSQNGVYGSEDDEWSFWDIFKMDEDDFFSAFPRRVDKEGEAYCVYDSDEMIAGADRNDVWMAYRYMGGDKIKCRGLGFNGSDSIYIIYAKKDTDVDISSEFEIAEGKFKLVFVAPDSSVSVLNETGGSNTVTIQLKEGRNVIKMVGRAAKLKNLEVSHSRLDKAAVESIYYSPEEEYADTVLYEVQKGNIDKEKIWEVFAYMDDETVSELLKELCKQGVTLTAGELEDIFIYGDENLSGRYLAEAIRNKEIEPLNGEMLRAIMYYVESDTLAELIMTMDKEELTFDVLTDCIYYLDEEEAGKCLMYYLKIGNSLTYSQYDRISYYLNEETRKKIESEMEFRD